MSEPSNKQEKKMRRMLRMTVFVDKSFAPLFTVRFTPLVLAVTISVFVILLIAGVTVLIAFTGLREYIPGYPTGEERNMIMRNLQRTDSLMGEVALRDNMLNNLRAVLNDELPESAWKRDSTTVMTAQTLANLNNGKSQSEKDFISKLDNVAKYDVIEEGLRNVEMDSELESMFFFSPLKGLISDHFNVNIGHMGVDVVAAEGTPIMSTLDGTVIFSEWTVQTGYVIMIQHDNQLVSVYKHNSRLLKYEGSRVRAGEAIAIIGDSGEFSNGAHLHFEMWYRGAPLDPENYINFESDVK